jgi:hypothetical protein
MNPTDSAMPTLSLLTAYRGKHRETNLRILLRWLQRIRETEGFADFELIVAEGDTAPIVREISSQHEWVRYVFTYMPHILNKSVLLNRSAEIARGAFVIPLDVDLLPAKGVLQLHVELAAASPRCLLAGYRVQVAESSLEELSLPTSKSSSQASISKMRAYLDQRITHTHYVNIYWTTSVLGFVRVFRKHCSSALVAIMRITAGGGQRTRTS